MPVSTECAAALLSFRYPSTLIFSHIGYLLAGVTFVVVVCGNSNGEKKTQIAQNKKRN